MTPKCPDCKRDQDDCICASPASAPEGWKLVPVEPTREMYEAFELCQSEQKYYAKDYYKAMLASAPTPSVSSPEVLDWLETELSAISCRYHGDPSYDHDAYWMRERVEKLLEEARKLFAAPTRQYQRAWTRL